MAHITFLQNKILHLSDIDHESEFWYYGFAVPYEVLSAREGTYDKETNHKYSDVAAYLDAKIHRQFINLGLTDLMIDTLIPENLQKMFSEFTKSEACHVYAVVMATDPMIKSVVGQAAAIEAAWKMLDTEFEGLCGGFYVPHPQWHCGGLKTVFYHDLIKREEKEREEKEREEKEREEKEREEKEREEKGREEIILTTDALEAIQINDAAHPEQEEYQGRKEEHNTDVDNHKDT